MKTLPRLISAGFALALLGVAGRARADEMVIKFPGLHPNYVFEAEPHALIEPLDKIFPGVGFRGTIVVLKNGFVPSINNSIGVTFGADWVDNGVWVPVAMQWNFWLSRNWSVFGEPGLAFRLGQGLEGPQNDHLGWLGVWLGGRYHFTDRFTLTLRVGRPTLSVGVSFLL
ncbi:MAG TPA: hypothetical protein VMI54_30625 [Polyangiaceae bacterium]|nr:hypothetical protein [Polyangiaceae bacterium]